MIFQNSYRTFYQTSKEIAKISSKRFKIENIDLNKKELAKAKKYIEKLTDWKLIYHK